MAKLHNNNKRKRSDYVKDVIGYPQSQTNRTTIVPVPGKEGDTPYIGTNGNWWIGGVDTGEEARGPIGPAGNNPDQEDITVALENGLEVLKFKDRAYQPQLDSGLGYEILRMNMAGGMNVLDADIFEPNTVYEIRYDFDLDGKTINLPENVTLKFNGGSLKNGTIVGDNTEVISPLYKIFHDDLNIQGKWICEESCPEWFGAISYPQDMNVSAWWWNPNSEVVNGEDSSNAFNKAIDLAQKSGGLCTAKNGIYKITDTVNIPNYVKLHIPSGSGVFAIMHGEGNVVIEGDKDSLEWKYVQQGGEPPRTLKVNEYFDSECMAVAFRMTARGTAITGGGTISIALSRHTIGILMEGNQFATINMVFAPELDIKVIGGSTNRSIPDPDDIIIMDAPNSPEAIAKGNVGDYAYFPNLPNKETRRKTNDTTWTFWCNESEFNTCFRTEVLSNDNRIINLHANLWLDWGFRGIENIARNGGWFNQAVWTGTVSDMHSNYVSFFGNSNQGLAVHDMSLQTYQSFPKMSSQCRIIALFGLTGSIKSGNTWDLNYATGDRVRTAYEYGKRAQRNTIQIDGERFERDESTYREVNRHIHERMMTNFRPYSPEVNILRYTDGRRAGIGSNTPRYWVKNSSPIDPYDYEGFLNVIETTMDEGVPEFFPKILFSENNQARVRVIDTVQGDLATSCLFIASALNPLGKNTKLVIDYIVGVPTNNFNQDVYLTVTERTFGEASDSFFKTKKLRRVRNSYNQINTVVIDEAEFRFMRNCWVMFTTPQGSIPTTLDIVSVRLLADSWAGNDISPEKGTTALRPNSAPKGHIYEDITLGTTIINKGDEEVQIWHNLPSEDVGTWSLNGDIITVSSCSYSKVGKQVNLSGRVTIPSGYELNSPIPVVLPFAPDFGGVYTIGDLEFTLGSNTNATLRSKATGTNKPFQLNFKTS